MTSTRRISLPAGGSGSPLTTTASPGMSCKRPLDSQKKWWWSSILVSKYERPGSTTTSRKRPASEIGRASCRERVEIAGGGGAVEKRREGTEGAKERGGDKDQ